MNEGSRVEKTDKTLNSIINNSYKKMHHHVRVLALVADLTHFPIVSQGSRVCFPVPRWTCCVPGLF